MGPWPKIGDTLGVQGPRGRARAPDARPPHMVDSVPYLMLWPGIVLLMTIRHSTFSTLFSMILC